MDELSLTPALELKDDAASGIKSVTVIHVGPATAEQPYEKPGYRRDDAIRVNSVHQMRGCCYTDCRSG